EVFIPMLQTLRVNREQMALAAREGFLTATDLAEYLVRKGLPFREAHEIVGRIVLYCLEQEKNLETLSLEEYRRFAAVVDADVFEAVALERALAARRLTGGPAPNTVRRRIAELRRTLGSIAPGTDGGSA
ncbi:MAG: argininosuccinate lyase, partial [Thermoanaerobacteraceae bacterium]|nr:argininosuccinate lyase [Thermoanaerobacteraceae bacterium]